MRKPAFCIYENKDADQLRGNREADQHLCFRYIHVASTALLPYARILIISYLSYQFRGLLENSAGQVIQLRDIPSFYDVIGESVRKTTCNCYSPQLIVNIGGNMLITCKVVGDSILFILSCVRNTLTMKIKSYEIIIVEIFKY